MKSLSFAGCAAILASACSLAAAQPQLLAPAEPAAHGPKLKLLAPRAHDPQDFVARTRDLLELATRNPAPEDSYHSFELAGINMSPAPPITSRSLQLLRREAGAYDAGVRDRALDCGKPQLPAGEYQVVVLDLSKGPGGLPVPVFLAPGSGELFYFELGLHRPGAPVVLLVAGYGGMALRVTASAETALAAVHLATYYPSVALGVDPGRVTRSYLPKDNARRTGPLACRYVEANPVDMLKQLQPPPATSEVFRPERGYQFAIGAVVPTLRNPPLLGNFLDLDMPVPYQYGLAVLSHFGYVRPLRIKGQGEHGPVHFGLEVVKPFRLPDGLYGGHLTQFLVREGATPPSGDLGHSSMYSIPRSW